MEYEKPPLGLMPREIWDETRMQNIREAMKRYIDAGKEIPEEWILEYDELAELYGEADIWILGSKM